MGSRCSKEEKDTVIVAQNGNGSATAHLAEYFSLSEILLIFIIVVMFIAIGYYIYKRCQQRSLNILRREFGASALSVISRPDGQSTSHV